MTGTPEDQGVIGRAVADVFAAVERTPDRDFLLQLSMMEIYNEVRALAVSSTLLPKLEECAARGRRPESALARSAAS